MFIIITNINFHITSNFKNVNQLSFVRCVKIGFKIGVIRRYLKTEFKISVEKCYKKMLKQK